MHSNVAKAALAVVLLVSIAAFPSTFRVRAAADEAYDIAILNGRVMDPESGLDAVRNVGIRAGKIARISTAPLNAKSVIEAKGLVVAPGFIDLHEHGQEPRNYEFQARDGVTTSLELEAGTDDVDRWYAVREGKALINFAPARDRATKTSRSLPGWFTRATVAPLTENRRPGTCQAACNRPANGMCTRW